MGLNGIRISKKNIYFVFLEQTEFMSCIGFCFFEAFQLQNISEKNHCRVVVRPWEIKTQLTHAQCTLISPTYTLCNELLRNERRTWVLLNRKRTWLAFKQFTQNIECNAKALGPSNTSNVRRNDFTFYLDERALLLVIRKEGEHTCKTEEVW